MNQLFDSGLLDHPLGALLCFIIYLFAGVVPLSLILYVVYYLFTLPLRRKERARLFLDTLQVALDQGHAPEPAIASLAETREMAFGVRFYLIAEQLTAGRKLSEALRAAPHFLPPAVSSVVRVGERTGRLQDVIPVCRHLVEDGVSQLRGALNYLVLFMFASTPVVLFIPFVFQIFVLPKLEQLSSELTGSQLPAFTRFVFVQQPWFITLEIVVLVILWGTLLLYLGGPRLARWLDRLLPGLPDRVAFALPWRRKRILRDFSATLALLLDAQVPEAEALQLAAEATNHRVILRRAQRVAQVLARGTPLLQALAPLDTEGEFAWRMQNVARGKSGFTRGLSGWHEALNARAFQLEQAAAQTVTTGLVLVNGFVVGSLVVAIFIVLIALTEQAILW